jgi:hypothetical protein
MKKAFVLIAMLIALIALFFLTIQFDRPVTFKDENLESAVRDILNYYSKPIYQSQLLTFSEIDLSYRNISDLSGIENFRNLEELNLNSNNIADVRPLQSLNALKRLDLGSNQISDLEHSNFSDISHLELTFLKLNHNSSTDEYGTLSLLEDISLLSELKTLEYLDIQHNGVSNVTPLSGLINLRTLILEENDLKDISPLENLKELRKLNLRGNDIREISVIRNFPALEYLNLHSNSNLESIAPLANSQHLEKLILRNVSIDNETHILKNLEELQYLNLQNSSIQNFDILADMMANGSLQDNAKEDKRVYLNIRDNILNNNETDPLYHIRPFWENISYREPYELPPLVSEIEVPNFSNSAGYYSDKFNLSLSTNNPGLDIYYTLDGSKPDPGNLLAPKSEFQVTYLYQGPIQIKSRSGEENKFSLIQTAYNVRSHLHSWRPPKGEVFKATVVRAIAYDADLDKFSNIVTKTFFVDEDMATRYETLPVISLVADYEVLFDPDKGIYITDLGVEPIRMSDLRVPANLEFFESSGNLGFQGRYEISLQGSTSRASPIKGLHVFTDKWSSGEDGLHYPLFEGTNTRASEVEYFDRFMIRAWGSGLKWPVFFADAYHQTLLAETDMDIQGYRPVIVFINGEYWGLQEIREASKNEAYYRTYYPEYQNTEFDLLDWGGQVLDEGDLNHWKALIAFVSNNDLSIEENYQKAAAQIDIDNIIDYFIHSIYTGKADWPGQNEYLWRPNVENGKWRWTQFDMDMGFESGSPGINVFDNLSYGGTRYHFLFNELLQNENFKNHFINRWADLMNTYFLTDVELAHFTNMANELDPYVPEFYDRWQFPDDWEEEQKIAIDIIQQRWNDRKSLIIDKFNLSGSGNINLTSDTSKGNISINSLVINADTPGIKNPDSWSGMYFYDIPIHLRAIPLPGHHFVRWEGLSEGDPFSDELLITLDSNLELKAVFDVDD